MLCVWTKASAVWAEVWPAGEVEQLVLVADCGFVLQLPHQHVDQVRVFDNDGHLFKHVLEANASLLQTKDVGREEKEKKMTLSGKMQKAQMTWNQLIQHYINLAKGRDYRHSEKIVSDKRVALFFFLVCLIMEK